MLAATGERSSVRNDIRRTETLAFHERVRMGFLRLASEEPIRFRVIDASMSLNQVQSAVLAALPAPLRENAGAATCAALGLRTDGGA